jgi:hypothetical protein
LCSAVDGANERLQAVDELALRKVKDEAHKQLLDGGQVRPWTAASGAEHIQLCARLHCSVEFNSS